MPFPVRASAQLSFPAGADAVSAGEGDPAQAKLSRSDALWKPARSGFAALTVLDPLPLHRAPAGFRPGMTPRGRAEAVQDVGAKRLGDGSWRRWRFSVSASWGSRWRVTWRRRATR